MRGESERLRWTRRGVAGQVAISVGLEFHDMNTVAANMQARRGIRLLDPREDNHVRRGAYFENKRAKAVWRPLLATVWSSYENV